MMDWLYLFGRILAGFAAMEVASYLIHRFLFHGVFWRIHETHHRPHGHTLEHNDLFSLGFAVVAMVLIFSGSSDPLGSWRFALGVGITLYGVVYFIVHDVYTHRRFFAMRGGSRWMQAVRRAHQRHHQSVEQEGNEPYGLLLFDPRLGKAFQRRRGSSRSGIEGGPV